MNRKAKEELQEEISSLNTSEFIALSKLYTNKDFPHCSITMQEVQKALSSSRPTALRTMRKLTEKGLVQEVKDFITFYYPSKNEQERVVIRQGIFRRLGILQ